VAFGSRRCGPFRIPGSDSLKFCHAARPISLCAVANESLALFQPFPKVKLSSAPDAGVQTMECRRTKRGAEKHTGRIRPQIQ
jgi:hypothetical protein